jgi:hypothetical protein
MGAWSKTPLSLDELMRTANERAKKLGAKQITLNPAWEV